MMIAPVNVARSIIPVGLNRSCAYHITSHRTKRPSASVLITSIVSPFIEVTTSPGRCALPEGIFSTNPTRATTLAAALRLAKDSIVPATTPAPPMSMVMSSMPPAGFREMPPVSKTTPFPIRAKGCAFSAPPFHCMTTTLEGLSDPCPTPIKARMPNFSRSASSNTSTSTPWSFSATNRLANSVVVRMFEGSFVKSRVKCTPSTIASAVSQAALCSAAFDSITVMAASLSSAFSVL